MEHNRRLKLISPCSGRRQGNKLQPAEWQCSDIAARKYLVIAELSMRRTQPVEEEGEQSYSHQYIVEGGDPNMFNSRSMSIKVQTDKQEYGPDDEVFISFANIFDESSFLTPVVFPNSTTTAKLYLAWASVPN